jgi:hypothetical protein
MTPRLPAHLEVSGLLRQVAAAGGFAAVLHKGEREAGTIIIVCAENGSNRRVYERMPSVNGDRQWTLSQSEAIDNKEIFDNYLARRQEQDPDLWIIELDIVNGERFIGLSGTNN